MQGKRAAILRSLCINPCCVAAPGRVRHFGLQARLDVCGCAGSLSIRLDPAIKRWKKQRQKQRSGEDFDHWGVGPPFDKPRSLPLNRESYPQGACTEKKLPVMLAAEAVCLNEPVFHLLCGSERDYGRGYYLLCLEDKIRRG